MRCSRPLARRLFAALALMLCAGVEAQPFGYASGTDPDSPGLRDALYRVDLSIGAATRVGYIGFRDVDGLAFQTDGTLYGAADGTADGGGSSDQLIRIDPGSGTGTFIAPLAGLAGLGPGQGGQLDYGLAAACDGSLWLSSDTLGELWRVDRANGAVERVISGGPVLSGLAIRGSELFGVSVEPDPALYRVDLNTRQLSRIGPLAVADRIFDVGLDFDADGRLWAVLDYLVPPDGLPRLAQNDLVEIDPGTGRFLSSRPITGVGSGLNRVQLEGLAVAPVACSSGGTPPGLEPIEVPASGGWTLLLLAFALFGAAVSRRPGGG